MLRNAVMGAVAALGVLAAAQGATPDAGYEEQLKRGIATDNIGKYLETLTARPTYPGAPYSKSVADQTLALFKSWGWDARIESYSVLFPRAAERQVELLTPTKFQAKLHEPVVAGDAYSAQQSEIIEPYFIYGPDGDVTAPLVYANFGLRDDYTELARLGVSVKDRIVLVRVGGMWRGGKVQLAAEHGAKGILIYSDPKEDGYFVEGTYPDGPGRTADGVQRGSILNGKYAGDPSTPLVASVKGAKRLPAGSAESSLALIPAMPLSYADAQEFLKSLQGQVVPESWRGALPVTYRTGPSTHDVHLKIKYRWENTDIYNVVARLEGTTWPDELVVRGNHHDGWVFGAQDPHSGHAALLEEARMLGELYKKGWRPRRSIVYASWDAEEQGTIGSTEFVEQHFSQLTKNAVAYINTDILGVGTITATGASSYARFVTEVAAGIVDPNSGVSALERAKVSSAFNIYETPSTVANGGFSFSGRGGRAFDAAHNRLRLGPPGYGSDHHSFVSHAGVASLGLMFAGDDSMGSYHTAYDNYAWFTRFNDPGFKYIKAGAELNGVAVMRLADATILPMQFDATADAIADQVTALKDLYGRLRSLAERNNAASASGVYRIAVDPHRPRTAPAIVPVPSLDFGALDQAAEAVHTAAQKFMAARSAVANDLNAKAVGRVNAALMRVERSFLRDGGVPGRPFYRNELYSPGRLWDTVPFPAVGDAMLDGQWAVAEQQIPLAARTLQNIATAIDAATAELTKSAPRATGKDLLEPLVGRWFGLRQQQSGNFKSRDVVDVEVRRTSDGTLELLDHNPSSTGLPAAPIKLEDSTRVSAQLRSMFGTVMFSGQLSAVDTMNASMGGEVFDARTPRPVVLKRNAPESVRYRLPRATASGDRELTYNYTTPRASADWPVATLDSASIDLAKIQEMVGSILRQQAEPIHNRTDAVVIVRNGKLVLEEYFWGNERDVPHAISSVTKSLTSMISGLAFDRGRIAPDDNAWRYFPEYKDTAWVREEYPVTLDHLWSMQANLAWNEDLPYQDPNNTAVGLITADDPVRYILNRPLAGTPGARYQYNSGLPTLIGNVVSHATGEPIEQFADRHLFKPLGIHNYRWTRQRNGEVLASGGVSMRPIDLAKLGQLMLDRGVWRGQRILSEQWIDRSTSARTKPADYAYGYYWHVADAAHPRLGQYAGFMGIGQGGQYLVVVPKLSLVVVLASSNWQPGGTRHGLDEIINKYVIPAILL